MPTSVRQIALHFVQDKTTRFDLAIECGNLDVALETARAIDRPECWNRLAQQALKQGNHKVHDMLTLQLAFLYVELVNRLSKRHINRRRALIAYRFYTLPLVAQTNSLRCKRSPNQEAIRCHGSTMRCMLEMSKVG